MPRIPVLSASALLAMAAPAAAQSDDFGQLPYGEQPTGQTYGGQTYGGQTYGGYQGWFPQSEQGQGTQYDAFARFAEEWGASPEPLVDSIPAKGTRDAGLIVPARYIPADPPIDSTLPSSMHYLSQIRADEFAVATDPGMFVFADLAARAKPRHKHGDTTFRVFSCAGYVYKRWYEYSRFEDAARSCGTDALCVFQVGTMWSSPGIASRPQLFQKAPGINPIPGVLRPRAADPVDGFSPLPLAVKNSFFAVPPAEILRASTQFEIDPAFATEANQLIDGVPTPPLHDLTDKMHWHVTQAAKQAPFGLSRVERKDIKFRLDRYQRLVGEYHRLRALLPDDDDVAPVDLGGALDDADLGTAEWESMVSFLGGAATAGPIPVAPSGSADGGLAPEIVAVIAYQNVVDEMADLLMTEWNHVDPEDRVTNDHGCLVGELCDWLPEMFASDYVGRFQKEREADMQKCLAVLPEALSLSIPTDTPWAADVLTMTAYLDAEMARLEALVASLPFAKGAETTNGSRTIRWGVEPVNESKGIRDLLHGEYAHHANAELGMDFVGDKICRMSAKVDAGIKAEFTAPNSYYVPTKHRLIDGKLLLLVARDDKAFEATAFLMIDDQKLLDISPSIPMTGGSWPAPPQETHFSIYEYALQFSILGIPAHLAVSVQGDLAFAPRITVPAYDPSCSKDLVADAAVMPTIEAAIDSSVNVDADGRLAIGVPGFSFGVNGHVDVLTATVPATARFRVVNDGGTPALSLKADARLDATLLGGHLSVYAEALFLYAEKAIFGWDGIPVGLELWNTEVRVPLSFLGNAFKVPASTGDGS